MNQELLRIVDSIARDKNIEREQIYTDIEQSIASALRKQFNVEDVAEFAVRLDRQNGEISATRQGNPIPLNVLGRIADAIDCSMSVYICSRSIFLSRAIPSTILSNS